MTQLDGEPDRVPRPHRRAFPFAAFVAALAVVGGALAFPLPAEAGSRSVTGGGATLSGMAASVSAPAPADVLASGQQLAGGQYRAAPGGAPRLVVQVDGNVVLSNGAKPLWTTATFGHAAAVLVMTSSGELQVRAATGAVLWSTGVRSPGAHLVVRTDGRIHVVATTGADVWASPPVARAPTLAVGGAGPVVPRAGAPSTTRAAATGAVGAVAPSFLATAGEYVNPASPAAVGARVARADGRVTDAILLEKAAAQGSARWLTTADSIARVEATVRAHALAAQAVHQTPVFVTYAIPDRDCGNKSAGGFTPGDYLAWSAAVARGLVGTRSVMLVEPDSLLHVYKCGDPQARFAILRQTSASYAAAGAEVYLDAGSSNSFGTGPIVKADMAARLTAAGVAQVAGFATNVANFQTTADEVAYGRDLSALLGGARFVVDTSRNGNGGIRDANGAVWCNPPGRALGDRPGATTDGAHVANLWVKTVGLSDGTCNGGPAAGVYWEAYLLGLAANAHW